MIEKNPITLSGLLCIHLGIVGIFLIQYSTWFGEDVFSGGFEYENVASFLRTSVFQHFFLINRIYQRRKPQELKKKKKKKNDSQSFNTPSRVTTQLVHTQSTEEVEYRFLMHDIPLNPS